MDLEVNYERDCPGCGETFTAKRSNQKFCEPLCKSQFHNNKSRGMRMREKSRSEITGEADAILWKNRSILFANAGKTVKLTALKAVGFDSRYLTHFGLINPKDSEKGNRFFIYDLSYEYVDAQTIKISNHE